MVEKRARAGFFHKQGKVAAVAPSAKADAKRCRPPVPLRGTPHTVDFVGRFAKGGPPLRAVRVTENALLSPCSRPWSARRRQCCRGASIRSCTGLPKVPWRASTCTSTLDFRYSSPLPPSSWRCPIDLPLISFPSIRSSSRRWGPRPTPHRSLPFSWWPIALLREGASARAPRCRRAVARYQIEGPFRAARSLQAHASDEGAVPVLPRPEDRSPSLGLSVQVLVVLWQVLVQFLFCAHGTSQRS